MGNRDKRDDKVKKPKKVERSPTGQVRVVEIVPPVEVVKKKKKEEEDKISSPNED